MQYWCLRSLEVIYRRPRIICLPGLIPVVPAPVEGVSQWEEDHALAVQKAHLTLSGETVQMSSRSTQGVHPWPSGNEALFGSCRICLASLWWLLLSDLAHLGVPYELSVCCCNPVSLSWRMLTYATILIAKPLTGLPCREFVIVLVN